MNTELKPEQIIEANLQNLHGKDVCVELRLGSVYIQITIKLHFQPSSSKNKCFGWSMGEKGFVEFTIESVKRISVVPDQLEKVIELEVSHEN